MHTLLITITTFHGSIDVEVPGDTLIEDLLPKLVEICIPQSSRAAQLYPTRWHLRIQDALTPLKTNQTLLEAGITDGTIVQLQQTSIRTLPQREREIYEEQFIPETILPSKQTGGIGVRWQRQDIQRQRTLLQQHKMPSRSNKE